MVQPDPCLCLAPHTYCFFLVAALLARSLAFSVAARAVSLAFSVASLAVSTSVLEGASPVTTNRYPQPRLTLPWLLRAA